MLMSSDVSGIPSFGPPPLSLCHFPLGVCATRAQPGEGRTEQSQGPKRFQRAAWSKGAVDKGVESGRKQGPWEPEDFCSGVQDYTPCLQFAASISLSGLGWVLSG